MKSHQLIDEGLRKSSTSIVREVISKIAWEMKREVIPVGDVAQLRRQQTARSWQRVASPAFWKIAVRHLEPSGLLAPNEEDWRLDREQRWVTILGFLAEMKGLHGAKHSFGKALSDAEVAEARVLRLLRANGEALVSVLRGLVHQLANRGQRVDLGELATLVLSDGAPWEPQVRKKIARDYYFSKAVQKSE